MVTLRRLEDVLGHMVDALSPPNESWKRAALRDIQDLANIQIRTAPENMAGLWVIAQGRLDSWLSLENETAVTMRKIWTQETIGEVPHTLLDKVEAVLEK